MEQIARHRESLEKAFGELMGALPVIDVPVYPSFPHSAHKEERPVDTIYIERPSNPGAQLEAYRTSTVKFASGPNYFRFPETLVVDTSLAPVDGDRLICKHKGETVAARYRVNKGEAMVITEIGFFKPEECESLAVIVAGHEQYRRPATN